MSIREAIEYIGAGIDLGGVILIVLGFVFASGRFVFALVKATNDPYRRYRQDIGRAILLGLEVLIAADIIRTVAVTPDLTSVAILAGIVLIRTFLSLSLQVELEGRFPWQGRESAAPSGERSTIGPN
ncbi:MAG TPA: DUF1622 domain-containing protein [Xanthobacteraceae bacterium]|jgi:uncharacterized membrane protein